MVFLKLTCKIGYFNLVVFEPMHSYAFMYAIIKQVRWIGDACASDGGYDDATSGGTGGRVGVRGKQNGTFFK